MFRFVGWLVVTGFALYGVSEFIDRHVVTDKDEGQQPRPNPKRYASFAAAEANGGSSD